MKDSNKIEKGFLFSLKIPQLIIACAILIFIITFFTSGCSMNSLTGNSTIGNENTGQNNGQISEETPVVTENASDTEDSGTSEETSATSEETENDSSSNEEITINVYYAEQNGEFLVGEARILSGDSKYVDAISEMMKEPIDGSLVILIPETTKINSVTVNDGLAKVDLSQNFIDDRYMGDTTDILLIYSIVNTLTEFPDVNSVEFYIDGTKLDVLGMLDLQGPSFRRNDLIKKD